MCDNKFRVVLCTHPPFTRSWRATPLLARVLDDCLITHQFPSVWKRIQGVAPAYLQDRALHSSIESVRGRPRLRRLDASGYHEYGRQTDSVVLL